MLAKVEFSRWATRIVPVPKKDGTFRICGDFKVTVNPALEVDQHPIPKPEHIFASLFGGQRFSTLDLTQAYQQLVLNEEAQELVTINTHLAIRGWPATVATVLNLHHTRCHELTVEGQCLL